jgi:hypothetical protein
MDTIFRKGDRLQLTGAARASGREPAGLGTVCAACNPTALHVRVLWDGGYGSRDGLYVAKCLIRPAASEPAAGKSGSRFTET